MSGIKRQCNIAQNISGTFFNISAAEVLQNTENYRNKFTADYPDYEIEVKLCAFTQREMASAQNVFSKYIK